MPNKEVEEINKGFMLLLFSPHSAGFSEAVRLKQAQAISAASKSAWAPIMKESLLEKVGRQISEEKSPVVRQELEKARQALVA